MLKILLSLLSTTIISSAAFAATPSCKTSPVASIDTNMGNIQVQLDAQKAPKSVANFVSYVNSGFYNGKIFHRVIPGFMIQGGGFDKNLTQAETKPPITSR